MEISPIGTVDTPFSSTEEAPRQGATTDAVGTIRVKHEYIEALDGLESGDRIVVVWFADRADRSLLRADRRGNVGVFDTRSPARPNPICLTTCEIVSIDRNRLEIRGVDMLDGSPILDLKPELD
ncbi:MAG: tRNA (N6-threonylcarbamoyladenosine(37)-N6)-methyltransferase TrmO [archaeon]